MKKLKLSKASRVLKKKLQETAKTKRAEPVRSTSGKRDATKKTIELAQKHFEFWYNPHNIACATLSDGSVSRHYYIDSLPFYEQLRGLYFDKYETAIGRESFKGAVDTLNMLAKRRGKGYQSALRIAHANDNIYFFLADDNWQVVEITVAGWHVVAGQDCPVRFIKTGTTAPLPTPVAGGDLDSLFDYLPIGLDDISGLALVKLWLLSCFAPTQGYATLRLKGKEGSGKSFATECLQKLIDPQLIKLRSLPAKEEDLMIATLSAFLLAFDNISDLSDHISDSLCRINTGGTFSAREHYERRVESLITALSPVILTGIPDFITRGDLSSRTFGVELKNRKIKSAKRLAAGFEKARPHILGALLDVVVAGLNRLPEVNEDNLELPRLADVSIWLTSCEEALKLKPGEAARLIVSNQREQLLSVVAEHPVVLAVEDFMEAYHSWQGTASELLSSLKFLNDKQKPGAAHVLSNQLHRQQSCLEELKIRVDFSRKGTKGRKLIYLEKFSEESDSSDQPTTSTLVEAPQMDTLLNEATALQGSGDSMAVRSSHMHPTEAKLMASDNLGSIVQQGLGRLVGSGASLESEVEVEV